MNNVLTAYCDVYVLDPKYHPQKVNVVKEQYFHLSDSGDELWNQH